MRPILAAVIAAQILNFVIPMGSATMMLQVVCLVGLTFCYAKWGSD